MTRVNLLTFPVPVSSIPASGIANVVRYTEQRLAESQVPKMTDGESWKAVPPPSEDQGHLAIANSARGVTIACFNSASRVMYSMARSGALAGFLGTVSPRTKVPTKGITFLAVADAFIILVTGLWVGPSQIFGFLGEMITLGVVIVYIAGNTALTGFMLRKRRAEFRVWGHCILPTIGSLLLLPVIYVTLSPFPPLPHSM